ncbi:hypothetical protein JW868_00590 [Candidatus Woesearchaeota archaeon]|nr:hypothetical protein [Candidatus Woesearchaeota archaeon]
MKRRYGLMLATVLVLVTLGFVAGQVYIRGYGSINYNVIKTLGLEERFGQYFDKEYVLEDGRTVRIPASKFMRENEKYELAEILKDAKKTMTKQAFEKLLQGLEAGETVVIEKETAGDEDTGDSAAITSKEVDVFGQKKRLIVLPSMQKTIDIGGKTYNVGAEYIQAPPSRKEITRITVYGDGRIEEEKVPVTYRFGASDES